MDMTDVALVSLFPAEGRAVFSTLFAPPFPDRGAGCAWHCRTCCAGGDETPVYCQRVNQFENDADNITREVLTAVRRTFITPFDPRRHQEPDHGDGRCHRPKMQQTAKAVVLFEVRSFEPPMREMGTLLVECANLVGRALPLMQAIGDNVAMLTAITEEIGKLEGRIDDLHDIGLKELVPQAPHRQHDGFRGGRRDLQASRKGIGSLRRRRQRDQLNRMIEQV